VSMIRSSLPGSYIDVYANKTVNLPKGRIN
jgi:hypothetical protein